MYYTQEQIDHANQADLVSFLQGQGEQLTRAGNEYRWKRHDSLTVRGNKWYRHSQSKGGSRKSEMGAELGLSGGWAAPFSPVSSSTASVKLLPKNSMTKSMGAPPLLWLCLYHLFPRIVRLSCRFQRYSCPARVSCSPCDCRKETRSAWLAWSICSWV